MSSTPASGSIPGSERRLALRVVTMPRDTNPYGTIFGGVILSYIDQAGFVEARRHGHPSGTKWVTVALDRVEFKRPVHLGDVVAFHATTIRVGTTSVTVKIEVEAERDAMGEATLPSTSTSSTSPTAPIPVTEATITLVCVSADGRPTPFARLSA